MRTKDDQKKEALFKATIKLVNEIGFAASSVSKIAKEANVSPSTIYVFFQNKEDLLISTYLEIKHNLAQALHDDFNDSLPIRDIIRSAWFSVFNFVSNNLEAYDYIEQFANSPYSSLVDKEALEKEYLPLINVLARGIEQKIIKNVDMNIISAFLFNPVSRLANPRLCYGLEMDAQNLEQAFDMAWDAIKL
ncbi:MAG: TetR/AcrR family transcriptional regulator [Thermodesulfobacteriota bacterium]